MVNSCNYQINAKRPIALFLPLGANMFPLEFDHTSNKFDSAIWHMCGKEPSLYGFNESEPRVSFEDRIKLHDKFTENCRNLKLPPPAPGSK